MLLWPIPVHPLHNIANTDSDIPVIVVSVETSLVQDCIQFRIKPGGFPTATRPTRHEWELHARKTDVPVRVAVVEKPSTRVASFLCGWHC
ncbi:Hypothetical protein NTJ_13951 [Nesidiocoris tenuis]|uniref:Uncharacterized protein n=1 Tax=Nesidiocoris tenuis TaxID=355587 RepID=A0ABN7BA02_9HEMI|nr:Hypothetical protein NTJ_13951 [Nesidiocoris tenuis]